MVDLCLTKEKVHQFDTKWPWEPTLRARKFSDVIKLPKFEDVRLVASRVYAAMDAARQVCPTLYWDGNHLELAYKHKSRIVTFVISRNGNISYHANLTDKLVARRSVALHDEVKMLSSILNDEELFEVNYE